MTSTTQLTSGAGLRPGPGPSREPSGPAPKTSPRAVRRRPTSRGEGPHPAGRQRHRRGGAPSPGRPPGRLASLDLARRVAEGPLDAKGKAQSRQARKQALTGASSSRWAGLSPGPARTPTVWPNRTCKANGPHCGPGPTRSLRGWPSALGKQEATTGRAIRAPRGGGSKTTVPTRSAGDQVAQDRSGPPGVQGSLLLAV